jgi:hypothetical protein
MTAEAPPEACVEVERVLDAPVDAVREILASAAHYPRWVESLRSFEQQDDGTCLAEFGYLGYRKRARMRVLPELSGATVWERVGGNTRLRIQLRARPAGEALTSVLLAWRVSGSGLLFGQYASSPIFRATLQVVAERSLDRLGMLAAGDSARGEA